MERDPEHPADVRPEGPADLHHGMVEEIREEIEHVVEHVPRPVRWTVRKLVILAFASLVALAVLAVLSAILYFSNRTELVAKELTLFINGTLAQRSDVSVSMADIKGNPFHGVTLIRPRVRFRDGNAPVLLESPAIHLQYSAWNLARPRAERRIDVLVDAPVIRLARREDGSLRLPLWKSAGSARQASRAYDVHLRLKGGTLLGPTPLGAIEALDLDALVSTSTATLVEIGDLRWKRGPFATHDLRLTGQVVAGDSVQFRVRRLTTPDLNLSAWGGWKKGSDEKVLHADVARVRWQWLSGAIDSKTFDVPGEGRITVDARGAHAWRGHFATDMTWKDLPVQANGDFAWADGGLDLRPIAMVSAAGVLTGSARWSKKGWGIGGDVRNGDPSKWSVIGLEDWPRGRLNGAFQYVVDSRRHGDANLQATLEASEIEGWHVDRGDIQVHFPPVGPDSFRVGIERMAGTVTLVGASAEGGWGGAYVARNFPLEEWPDGRASGIQGILEQGEGTVAGHGGELQVTGRLNGTRTDWLGAKMAAWRLDDVSGRLLPTPDLTARARLDDVGFLGIPFDSASIGFHLGDRAIALERIEATAGDTLFTAAGAADWSESGWHIRFDRAQARSATFDWIAEPPVALSGDRFGVVFDRLRARDGDAQLAITGRWGAPGGSFDWALQVNDLDLSRTGLPREWQLAGLASGRLEIRGAAADPHWGLDAQASHPGWQGHAADSLALSLTGQPHALTVRHGWLRVNGGTLTATGTIAGAAHEWPDSLTGTAVTRWLATGDHWDGTLAAKDLSLDRLERIQPAAVGWGGKLSGSIEIDGSPARPVLALRAESQPLSWRGYQADDLQARATYRDERLTVEEIQMNRKSLASTIHGSMGLKLALGARPEVPEQPMSWRLDMPNGDLSVLPLFVPQIGFAAGKLVVAASIAGTPRHPDLDGTVRVEQGKIRLAGRDELVTGVRAVCRLDESRITLDSLSAQQGEKGRVFAQGSVELSDAGFKGYRFEVQMRDFTALETGIYAARFDGNFTVTDGVRMNHQILPMVTGSMKVHQAVVLFDFANQSDMQRISQTAKPLFWTYRIQLDADDNLKWQPPDGDIEFSADLLAEQKVDRLDIEGEMHALRGTYYFLSNRFTVKKADLVFHGFDGANPEIDAEGTTRIVPSREPDIQLGSTGESRPEVHTVTVSIKGKSSEPVIEFASDPPDWDEARILQELTVGRFFAGGVTLGDPLDNYLTRAINKTLSAEMSRAFRGYLNEWEVQREQGGILAGQGDLIVGVGTQITPNLQLRFRQRVPGLGRDYTRLSTTTNPFERDVEAEYRINRFFFVTSELTQRRNLSGTTGTGTEAPEFNVNLKARWEY